MSALTITVPQNYGSVPSSPPLPSPSTLSLSPPPPTPLSILPPKTSLTPYNPLSYVLLSATMSSCVSYWLAMQVGRYRRIAKVPYPNAYATAQEMKDDRNKYLFNCAQRSHMSFLEHQPQLLLHLLISGLKYPTFSAAMGLLWCLGRIHYAIGYVDPQAKDGEGRRRARYVTLPQLALLGGSLVSAVGLTGLGGVVGGWVEGLVGK
ncbi:MAG: hypothetical protein L6R37_008171 [Teloschistes peruensis]|nr:MAG: hypothetical protein L6R37_008171 [Teloschistes peruensis]